MKTLLAGLMLVLLTACAVQPSLPVCQPGQLGPCKAVDEGLGGGDSAG